MLEKMRNAIDLLGFILRAGTDHHHHRDRARPFHRHGHEAEARFIGMQLIIERILSHSLVILSRPKEEMNGRLWRPFISSDVIDMCRWQESNLRQLLYEGSALPLSYTDDTEALKKASISPIIL